MHDVVPAFAKERPRLTARPAQAPARQSLLALFGRLGAPGRRAAAADPLQPLAAAADHGLAASEVEAAAPSLATRAQNRLRRLRDEARAAYASVVGSHDAALDAALAVVEAEWRAAACERDRYGEALKAIRLYAGDAHSRQRARHALEGRDDWGRSCACGGGRGDA
jgi:hypothetical protein